MNPTNAGLLGASGGGDRPPTDRNNCRSNNLCGFGTVAIIIMSIVIFVGILFLFVVPLSRSCTNSSSSNQCAFESYVSMESISYFFSGFNFALALLITLCVNRTRRCESISFYVLGVVVFVLFLLIKFFLEEIGVLPGSELSSFCYVVSALVLFITFGLRLYLRRFRFDIEVARSTVDSPLVQNGTTSETPHTHNDLPFRGTPPPPYTYFPEYDQIAMVDLPSDPPPYREPPPVYTSLEHLGEEETEFGENGAEEDPYEDMPDLED
ncbi:hypothetical protein [Candidatus Similichlamydia epinepheli]|uniref:hypothetical protein n=1 Tax=Candidatus Similichlamydia epinepheli TaxID=1903953 RepID=UPI000D3C3673|nr:hypothetical protein [Candidatus Similichlamydia epinepheli]